MTQEKLPSNNTMDTSTEDQELDKMVQELVENLNQETSGK